MLRLHSVDLIHGFALVIVLLDLIDLWARPVGFFRDWTLMGLGFSDAAEGFVFRSESLSDESMAAGRSVTGSFRASDGRRVE